jgi:hypothetical protein
MRFLPLLALIAIVVQSGCGPKGGAAEVAGPEAVAPKGAEVSLVLLRQLEAGSTREGTLVPFMVEEDVLNAEGKTVLEKGSIAEGEVTWSRSEGTLSGMMGKPARLEVSIKRTRAPGGETVLLQAGKDDPKENFAFTRGNTGLQDARVDTQGGQSLTEQVRDSVDEFFETGDASNLNAREEVREWLRRMASENEMEELREKMDGSTSDLEKVVRSVRDGSITKLTAPEMVLAVNAVMELGRLAHSVERSIGGKLKGRTIKAFVGTRAKAYISGDAKVHAKQ